MWNKDSVRLVAYSVAHTEVKRRESTSGETTNPPERKVHERTPHEQTARNRTASFPWANHHPGFEATVAFVPSTVPGSAEEPTIFPPELYRRRRRLAGESFISRHHGLFESATETQKPTGPPKERRLSSEFHNWSDEDALGHLFMQEGDGLPHELWTAHSYVPGRQLHPSRVNGVAIDRGAREILVTETPQTGWKVQGWEPGDELLENPLLVQDILDALSPGRSVADVPSRLERGSDRHGKPGSHIRTEELQSGDVSGNSGNSDSAPPAASRGPFPSYLQFANATACPPRTESEDVAGASHGLCPEWHGIGQVQQKSDMVSGDRQTTVVYTIRPRSSIQLPLEVSKQGIWHPNTDNMTIALEIMVACLSEGFAQFQLRTSKPKLTMASGLVSVEIDAVHSEPIFMPCEYTQEVQLAARGRSEVKGEIVQNL
ncbi:hypothetical protein TGRUB_213760 [Toxoplasma gondii RUB]|uniref:Uncharacterized protein n=1 Tax=Toxoplasma gondii RUB TaxID=935652 RepID=A0A086M2N1_TOXGO|nr:hypothetical protein TGRUB_213760 [Toxoplasma gondii RUB]